jgi:hypothetical protein
VISSKSNLGTPVLSVISPLAVSGLLTISGETLTSPSLGSSVLFPH